MVSAAGRFIGAFEKGDEVCVFEKTVLLERSRVPVRRAASAVFCEGPLFLQPAHEKLLPVCSAAEWFASHTRPFAVRTLHVCLKAHDWPLLHPLALL